MRVALFVNNWVGWRVVQVLRSEFQEDLVALFIHPKERQKYGKEILAAAQLNPDQIFEADALDNPDTLTKLEDLKVEIGISAYFGYILRGPLLKMFPFGCFNLHPAYLPYNRGANPNIWSILEHSPAGVTIHVMDSGIDTGDIVVRREVVVQPTDTGGSLYKKLEIESVELFREAWPLLVSGKYSREPQSPDEGCYHRTKDLVAVEEIDLDREYTGRELIDLIRARTFPPYPGAYFKAEGEKIYVRIQLSREAWQEDNEGN